MEHEIFNRHAEIGQEKREQSPVVRPDVLQPHRDERGRFAKIDRILDELAKITTDQVEHPIIEISPLPLITEGPLGIVADKEIKRKIQRSKETPTPQHTEMLVVLNDLQLVTSTDQEALGASFKFITKYKDKITHLVLNGDISDYEQQTSFAKSPDAAGKAGEEIEATKWVLEWLSLTLPNAKKVMVDGNHEERWGNYLQNQTGGLEEWIKTPDEMFNFEGLGFEHIKYGAGAYYEWHDRLFWHGHRSGTAANVPKLEVNDAGMSVSTGHINRNMMHEQRDARGHLKTGLVHAGFSKDNLHFMKKANTGWTQGFGVYYWDKQAGEHAYSIRMVAGNPKFIWEGEIFDGTGFEVGKNNNERK